MVGTIFGDEHIYAPLPRYSLRLTPGLKMVHGYSDIHFKMDFFADRCQEAGGGDVESKERGRQFCHASSPRQQGLLTKRSLSIDVDHTMVKPPDVHDTTLEQSLGSLGDWILL